MSYETAAFNDRWAYTIIDQLYKLGVEYFCLAPGSRSTALALAVSRHPRVTSFVHFDERGLGFHAYGYAKASSRPVALIVTSGTAVGNLFPAIMEASFAQIPLLVLTADRPPELRDCGANQTADQVKIFGDYVRWQIDLPCPDPHLPENFLCSTLAQAVFRATHSPSGPVHINCMLREPFFTFDAPSPSLTPCIYEPSFSIPPDSSFRKWKDLLSSYSKGVIVVGSHAGSDDISSFFALAEMLDWPICADITSPLRSKGKHPALIPYFDTLLQCRADLKTEAVLHLGDRFVSKTLAEWIASHSHLPYFLVTDHPLRYDPKHSVTHRMQCDPSYFCRHLLSLLSPKPCVWIKEWQQGAQIVGQELPFFLEAHEKISEPGVLRELHYSLPSDWVLFLANSMPVRDADNFFFPDRCVGPVLVNRGVSGIDGNIATVAGIGEALKKPVVAVLGDQTFLHDLNSLAQVKKSNTPLIIVLINNGGGGIFSFLPIANKKETFEEFFAAAHDYTFEKAADFFDLPYFCPAISGDWSALFQELAQDPRSCIVEIHTERRQNVQLHKTMTERIKTKLCSLSPLTAV